MTAIAYRAKTKTWSPIGLDLGAGGMRAVQLRREGRTNVVVVAVRHEFPPLDAEAASPPEPTAQSLRQFLKSAGFKGRSVVAGLGPPDVEYHPLELPTSVLGGDPHLADMAVCEELERVSLRLQGPMEARFWALPPSGAAAPTSMGVAASRIAAGRTADLIADAGYSCTQLAVTAGAVANFAYTLGAWEEKHVGGILDIGQRQSRLVVCADGEPVCVRHVGPGGQYWTQRVADALDVSLRTAEVQKRDCGSATTGTAPKLRTELASLVVGALRREVTDLAGEIKRSYEYVMRCYPGRAAGDLLLTGGGSLLSALPTFFQDALGIRVRGVDEYLNGPNCRLKYSGSQREPLAFYGISIGLALGE